MTCVLPIGASAGSPQPSAISEQVPIACMSASSAFSRCPNSNPSETFHSSQAYIINHHLLTEPIPPPDPSRVPTPMHGTHPSPQQAPRIHEPGLPTGLAPASRREAPPRCRSAPDAEEGLRVWGGWVGENKNKIDSNRRPFLSVTIPAQGGTLPCDGRVGSRRRVSLRGGRHGCARGGGPRPRQPKAQHGYGSQPHCCATHPAHRTPTRPFFHRQTPPHTRDCNRCNH